MVGYGKLGTGDTGTIRVNDNNKHIAYNKIDADISKLKNKLGTLMSWSPLVGSQFVADFDNGNTLQDALGLLIKSSDTGLGTQEGLIAPGDSGGPAFINKQLAGVASYVTSLSLGNITPDIDSTTNSSFGEIASWQKVSYYQQWIDQSIRSHYPNAPTMPEEVVLNVPEGSNDTISYVYFLVQFIGDRTDETQPISIDYKTRDGSAVAGQDYIKQTGTLMLYPNENQAVIAIEILGDNQSETDETLYLDIYNPIGGHFQGDATTLTAIRTIVNDDGIF
jgi:hypothetical protein